MGENEHWLTRLARTDPEAANSIRWWTVHDVDPFWQTLETGQNDSPQEQQCPDWLVGLVPVIALAILFLIWLAGQP